MLNKKVDGSRKKSDNESSLSGVDPFASRGDSTLVLTPTIKRALVLAVVTAVTAWIAWSMPPPSEPAVGGQMGSAQASVQAAVNEASQPVQVSEASQPVQPAPQRAPGPWEANALGNTQSDEFVECNTSKGKLRIKMLPAMSPIGVGRFMAMLDAGYFSSKNAFFRVVPNFLAQFGLAGDPAMTREWNDKPAIPDDKQWLTEVGDSAVKPFRKGMLSFAGSGKDSRRIEMFFALSDSEHLGKADWETPIGQADEASIPVLDALYAGYGDLPEFGGKAPDHGKLFSEGYAWWAREHPDLDYIEGCSRAQNEVVA